MNKEDSLSEEENSETPVSPTKKPLAINERNAESKKKINRFTVGAVSVVLLAGLSVGSYYGYEWYSNKDNVEVPEATKYVAYESETSNETLCSDFVDLSLQCEVNWTTDENADRGNLLAQSIATGEQVDPGTKVVLTYSMGPSESEFPNLVGQELSESEEVLYEMGVTVTEVTETEGDGIPAGRIVSTSIDSGAVVENGTEVSIQISDGAIEIPDWTGKSKDFVEADSQKYGITVEFVEETSDKTPGIALSQDPAAGEVTEDATVKVNIAKPAEIVEVEVPEVKGLTIEEAQSLLAVSGFTNIKVVSVTSSSVDSEQVTEIVPGVGQKASTDSQIVVVVSQPESSSETSDPTSEETE